jgi:hypothetical protein
VRGDDWFAQVKILNVRGQRNEFWRPGILAKKEVATFRDPMRGHLALSSIQFVWIRLIESDL